MLTRDPRGVLRDADGVEQPERDTRPCNGTTMAGYLGIGRSTLFERLARGDYGAARGRGYHLVQRGARKVYEFHPQLFWHCMGWSAPRHSLRVVHGGAA